MNQIIAAAILFGIITVVFAPIIVESASRMFSSSQSVSDMMENTREQTGQLLVLTHVSHDIDGTYHLSLSNIGIEDIRIRTVLTDGTPSEFYVYDQDLIIIQVMPAQSLAVLTIQSPSVRIDNIHIITDTGKIFEFHVS